MGSMLRVRDIGYGSKDTHPFAIGQSFSMQKMIVMVVFMKTAPTLSRLTCVITAVIAKKYH